MCDVVETNFQECEEKTEKEGRLSTCEVCAANVAKYTCPKCAVKSCCLDCVNIHKKELDCDGIRDRTKFIPLQDFTNSDFYTDYAFLEECSRFVYGKKRNIAKKYTNIDKPLPHYLNKLKRIARARGTAVMFLPEHFARRKSNCTRVAKTGEILWKVDFVFGDKLHSHKGSPIAEGRRLNRILKDRLEDLDSSLDSYKSAGLANVRLLLKAERVSGCKFYELDATLSLRDNLKGKCIIEYPTVFALLKDHSYGFDIVHSDDELEESKEIPNDNNTFSEGKDIKDNELDNTNPHSEREKDNAIDTSQSYRNNRKRTHRGELTTVRVAREERERIEKEMKEEAKKKPKNLLFITGYSSEEGIEDD